MDGTLVAPHAAPLDGVPHRPAPRARTMWQVAWAVICAGVSLIGGGPAVLAGAWPLAVALAVAGAVGGAAFGTAVWRHRTWALTDRSLELRHGVVVLRASSIPYTRIQQIDLERGPLERIAGLSQLVVRTAAATTDGKLYGLLPDDAVAIRARLLELAGVDDAV